MSDPIVDRIDALVRKRRSFVASTAESAEPAALAATEAEDDIPVLTDIVDVSASSGESPAPAAPPPLRPMLDALAADLSHAIEDRLAVDLPEILDGALEQLGADLRRGIADSVDAACRDFLARRQQLRLPFPDNEPRRGSDYG